MRIFITGGTGLIGSAIIRNLIARHHKVFALGRSETSRNKLIALGATPITGDIHAPQDWCDDLPEIDGVIHAACDFSDAMTQVDQALLDHLIPVLHRMPDRVRFLYTGGSWLFGANSPDQLIDEAAPFDPLPEFRWMIDGINRVLDDNRLDGMVIHPACVYGTDPHGHTGLLATNIETARTRNYVHAVGGNMVHLPIVHNDDLADLYRLMLEHAKPGAAYFGVGINGISNRKVAERIASHFGRADCDIRDMTPAAAMKEYGNWARGLGRNQFLSGRRAAADLGWKPRHTDLETDIASIAKSLDAVQA
ncbi:NAD-dependent epimerase/dehydratase family protein [Thalassospira sp. SM2505]